MHLQLTNIFGKKSIHRVVRSKPWKPIDREVLERVWSSETLYSYLNGKVRWYVFQYSPSHQVHYAFQFTSDLAVFQYFFTETKNYYIQPTKNHLSTT